jgi:hypothetical protein
MHRDDQALLMSAQDRLAQAQARKRRCAAPDDENAAPIQMLSTLRGYKRDT